MSDDRGWVVDANVVHGIFCDAIEAPHRCTGSPTVVISALVDSPDLLVVDESGNIEHEWRSCVDPEWFDAWFVEFVSYAPVVAIPVGQFQFEIKKLTVDFGLPSSRDRWVVRTALAGSQARRMAILTDDGDLFDPKVKTQAAKKARILSGALEGKLAKHLRKKFEIDVVSVALAELDLA